MKKNILLGSLVALIFSGILFSNAVGQQFPSPQTRHDGPPIPIPPRPGEMFQRMEETMRRLRGDTEWRSHCKTLMRTPLFLDCPAVIRAQAESLNLSSDQIQKLTDIENEARKKSKSLLDEAQLKQLGNIPEKPVVMSEACLAGMLPAAEQLLQGIIRGQGTTQEPGSKSDDSEKKSPIPAE
jgi:hypothetical protein